MMNCPKCNEPLRNEIYRRNDYQICFYCDGAWLNKISLVKAGILDTLQVTTDITESWCPECGSTKLLKSYYDDVELEHCPICKGILFDAGELEKSHPEYKDADIDEIKSDAAKGIAALAVIGAVIRIIAKIASRDL